MNLGHLQIAAMFMNFIQAITRAITSNDQQRLSRISDREKIALLKRQLVEQKRREKLEQRQQEKDEAVKLEEMIRQIEAERSRRELEYRF